jgi:ubiquinone/menaquinone biosynthesis C-methylase UbiE
MIIPRPLLKIAFHLLYHQLAWSYEGVAWAVSFGQWGAWRRLALDFLRPGPTLELAYGPGVLFAEMTQAGLRPVGVDLSPYMARLAGDRLRRQKLPLRLTRAKAQKLPFPAGHFANVVATFPTDYMLAPDTLAEIYRVLQPGGRLVVVFEGELCGPWPLSRLIEWLYEVTGQRSLPPAKPLQLLLAHSFEARWHMAERDGARAQLLVADKQSHRA